MNHDCITNCQGRQPCTCGSLHTANSDGSSPVGDPWDWAADLRAAALQTIALVVCAAALGTAIFLIFK